MKLLTLIRHAKSDHGLIGMKDIERPLNDRGLGDVKIIRRLLDQRGFDCDAVYCSPAVRARETARGLFSGLPPGNKLQTRSELYTFDMDALFRFIEFIDSDINHAVIVGHNPAITLLSNQLANCGINNVPTCAIVELQFAAEEWIDLAPGAAQLIKFDRPANHR